MNCKEIINQWLKDNGYGGLYYPGECACKVDDLMPCDDYCGYCEPGYLTECEPNDGFDFRIGPQKQEADNESL